MHTTEQPLTLHLLAFVQHWLLRVGQCGGNQTGLYARLERAERYLLRRNARPEPNR